MEYFFAGVAVMLLVGGIAMAIEESEVKNHAN